MKRPLVVLAAGYVLGEVLALQVNTAVDTGVLAWLCAAAAGILWLLDTGREYCAFLLQRRRCRAGATGNTECFCSFWHVFWLARLWGWPEGEGERDSGQGGVCGPDHERGSDTGKRRNKKAEQKEDTLTLILEQVTAEAGGGLRSSGG
ncbi:MAG: hypothetical protein ACLR0U_08880 [Enterocloster clostridioformis]